MATPEVDKELLVFNGIDGRTGQYLIPPMRAKNLVNVILGERELAKRDELARLREQLRDEGTFELLRGLDAKNLAEAGWGVLFPASLPPDRLAQLKDALKPLLDHRQQQAGGLYREYSGDTGYKVGQSAQDWLAKRGAQLGRVDPTAGQPPYYLLIVGDPNSIPFEFQYNLDVDRATGRLYFDTLDEFENYARSVVAAENGQVARARRATFFGVRNPGDRATELSLTELVEPLAADLLQRQKNGRPEQKRVLGPWQFNSITDGDATRARLSKLLGGEETPALLFTASHGIGFNRGDPEQLRYQGALVCGEWGGPFGGGIQRDMYFAGEDLKDTANVFGMMAFHFACYGGGTPYYDEFYERFNKTRAPIAPYAFLSKLPQRLLAHPRGGALAVIAHVERAWTYSFKWDIEKGQTTDFFEVLYQLMDGFPIGNAMESMNTKYASIAAQLTTLLAETDKPDENALKLARAWTGNKDARDYTVIGDPAVKLPVVDKPEDVKLDKAIELVPARNVILPPVLDPATDPRTKQQSAGLIPVGPDASGAGQGGSSMVVRRGSALDDEAFEVNAETVKSIAGKVGGIFDKLAEGFENITDLQVRTYTSQNLADAAFPSRDQPAGRNINARAMTVVHLNGNTDVVVPMNDQDQLNSALWKVHKETVEQAWQNRAELLRVLADILASFRPKLG